MKAMELFKKAIGMTCIFIMMGIMFVMHLAALIMTLPFAFFAWSSGCMQVKIKDG